MREERLLSTLDSPTRWLGLALTIIGLSIAPIGSSAADTPDSIGATTIKVQGNPARVVLQGDSYRVSLDGVNFSRALPRRGEILLRYKTFDPLLDAPPSVQPELRAMAHDLDPQRKDAYIVQFHTQALVPYQEALHALGAEITVPLPHHALIVRMDSHARKSVAQLPFVRWLGAYQPAFKLQPGLESLIRDFPYEPIRYNVMVLKRGMQQGVANEILNLGGSVEVQGESPMLQVTLNGDQLKKVAELSQVLYIDEWTGTGDDMDMVRAMVGADYLQSVEGYTGQGVRGQAFDDGVRDTHQDFQQNPPQFHTNNNPSDFNHGTPVYGIIFGSGYGDAQARGLLPDAEQPLFASRYQELSEYGGRTDRYTQASELVDPAGPHRGVFQSSSWGHSQTQSYTNVSSEMDGILFDLDFLYCQSQSNTGNRNSRPEAWAKNAVSVGGIHNDGDDTTRSGDYWQSASIGPAADGRIKPDLSNQYGYVWTTDDTGDTRYANFGGTSGATPATAGAFGLLFQMWADGVFDGGPGKNRDVFNTRPHFTTAKAIMINSAYQYPFSGESHNLTRVHQGWGFPDVQSLYDVAQANSWSLPILIDESAILAPLDTHTYSLDSDGTGPLKATLVYADPPGTTSSSLHRINDLTLKVTSPGGTIYWGNNGLKAGNWSTSGGSPNTIDTVENVFIQNPTAGTWTIQVLGDEIVQDSHVETSATDADYALVVTGGSSGPNDPPAAPTGLSATAGDGSVSLDWNDNTEPDLSGYNVKRSTTSGGSYTQIASSIGSSSFVDSAASNGTTYYYVVTAVDSASNESGNSNEASATPVDQSPAAPTGLTAAAGNGSVSLDWADNSEPDLANYRVKRSMSSGGPYSTVASPTSSAHTDTGLTNGTTYFYVVSAVDSGSNESADSVQVSASPGDPPPAAPTGLAATAGNSQVSLDWADNGEPDLAGYKVKRATSSGGPYSTIASPTTSSYSDSGLTNGTTYYYVVSAIDAGNNESPNSSQVSATPSDIYAAVPYSTSFDSGSLDSHWTTQSSTTYGRIQVTTANSPRTGSHHLTMDVTTDGNYTTNEAWLHVNLGGKTDVDLVFWWKEFSDENHSEDGVFLSDDAGASFVKVYDLTGGNSTYQEITLDLDQLAGSNGLSLTDTFVVKFQQHDNYELTTDGFAFDDVSVTPLQDLPPAAPTGLSASAGNQQVNLNWADNSEPDLANYRVKRSTSAGGPYSTIASPSASSFTDTGLTNGTTYYYVVSAVDGGGQESGDSSEASATPTEVASDLPYSTSFDSGSLDARWTTQTSTSYGRIQVTTANSPHTGSHHLTMDVSSNGNYTTNEAWLQLDLSGEANVQLSFWWKEFKDESHSEDGVYLSDDGGASFVKVHNLTGGSSTYEEIVLDLDQLASANGLTLGQNFVIKFQQYDNYQITTDGMAFDDMSVTAQ